MTFIVSEWLEKSKEGEEFQRYVGTFSPEVITTLLDDVEKLFDEHEEIGKIRKTVYSVLVESLQNLYHHTLPEPDAGERGAQRFGAYMLCRINDTFRIITGNYVRFEKVQMLKDRIDQINALSKDELKTLYKMILNNEEFSEKGGGGLGMIDIARKTGTKLEYEFYPVNEKFLFYGLKINVI